MSAGSPLGPGPDTGDITKSMINYHYESYSREKHKKGRERDHEGGVGGCVGPPGGSTVPGIETTDLGGL